MGGNDFFEEVESHSLLKKGQQFAHYQIIEELGRGGMGIVYKAFDINLRRIVALKLLLQNTERSQQRFLLESNAMAKFENLHIARIYEINTLPKPYFTMEYVEGITLAEAIQNKSIKSTTLVKIMIKVCNALYKIHKEGILHRDLKPSNIMIDKNYEPKIMDFGLVKFSDTQLKSLSKSNSIIGTLCYMAPEQIQGKETERSDIYSIGACIYEALTYRTPYQGDSDFNILYQILHSPPIPPRELNPDISIYLEAICLKCLAKKPHKRYDNFRELAQELKNYENNRPIIAKKYGTWRKIQQQIYRYRILYSSVAFVLCTLFVAFFIAYTQISHALAEKTEALNQLYKEKQETDNMAEAVHESLFYTVTRHEELLKDKAFISPIGEILKQVDRLNFFDKYLFLRALISDSKEEWEKAVQQWEKYHQKNTPSYSSFLNMGVAYFYAKQYTKALESFNNAIKKDSTKSLPYYYKSRSFIELKNYAKAIDNLDLAISINKNRFDYYQTRGYLLHAMKKYELSLADYDIALKLNKENNKIYYERGTVFMNRGIQKRILAKAQKDFDSAIRDFDRSLQINPNNTGSYFNKAYIARQYKNFDLAIEYYSKLLQVKEKSNKAYRERGMVYFDKEDYKNAIADWEKLLSINQKHFDSEVKEKMKTAKLRISK